MAERLALSLLPKALVDAGYPDVGLEALIEYAQDGWIPAEKDENGQWFFDPAFVQFIAVSLFFEEGVG